MLEGNELNLKLTTELDLKILEEILWLESGYQKMFIL
jgi:2-C-methyl-D-erythritol 4-phosphate cytidylyltransferase